MHRSSIAGTSVSERKFAEKLTILNERGQGILTRVYNIKKACMDPSTRPSCLAEKQLEAAIKHINRRFPNVDTKDKAHLTAISSFQKDILTALPNYYYTFVGVMEFKDITSELVTSLATSQFHLDISLNYDLTKSLLDLCALFVSMMILVGQIEDRRAMIGLYSIAHETQRGSSDSNFPRLAQMIVDYEHPVRKMAEEFIPLSKLILQATMSLCKVFVRRNLPAEQLRTQNVLSVSANPQMMLSPTLSNELPCEFLSLETMHRWILLGFLLCSNQLSHPGASDLWKLALQDGYAVSLYRDEVLAIHSVYEKLLSDSKDKSDRKRVSDVNESLNVALLHAGPLHRDRRKHLTSALKELFLLVTDSPGLLGPKCITVLTALTLACDEVKWLFKHTAMNAPKGKHKPVPDDYVDPWLHELLFYIISLKSFMRKNHRIIQTYYLRFMGGFDAQLMRDVVMRIQVCPEDESLIMTSFVDTLARLQGKETDDRAEFDFQALRLDWFRLQVLTSVNKAALSLKDREHGDLAPAMNTVVVHSKMADSFEELLVETCDLSFLCFFYRQFEGEFNKCLKNTSQVRYIIAYPLCCSEFMNSTTPYCPEERINIGDRCVNTINHFLELIAKEVKTVVGVVCAERLQIDEQLIPSKAVGHYLHDHPNKGKQKSKAPPVLVEPGKESKRKTLTGTMAKDSNLHKLVDICYSVNCFQNITAWDHTFVPREYLVSHLEDLFIKNVFSMLHYSSELQEISRPSEVLMRIQSFMASLRLLELHIHIDMTRVLTAVLLQETQLLDSKGDSTITSTYTSWYTSVLLKRVSSGGVCFSKTRHCFVSRKALLMKAEEYTDIRELEALAEIIGPYGVRFLGEKLMEQISGQVKEIKKLVKANQDTLLALHTNRDKPDIFNEVLRKLRNTDDLLARTVIVGILMAFRKLTLQALHSVLCYRIPFMLSSIEDFKSNLLDRSSQVANNMASSAGIMCDVDPLLVNAMRAHCDKSKEDYDIWKLFLAFVGVTLPELALKTESNFIPNFEGHENNAHCLAIAVNALAGAIFGYYGPEHQRDMMKEFLVFTSSRIMTLAKETEKEKDAPKAREAIYVLLDLFVSESPFLTRDLLEGCFPYSLIRDAYNFLYKKQPTSRSKTRDTETPF